MLIWFAALSVAIVWTVFRSPAIDFRVVALGSVLGVAEAPFGIGPFQTLAAPVVALGLVMALTVGRRLVRRRWLGLPIGMFLHVVLNGAWSDQQVFWWPVAGVSFPDGSSSIVSRGIWSLVLELVGVMVVLWWWQVFGLDDADRRRRFWRTGQLDRGFMAETGGSIDD